MKKNKSGTPRPWPLRSSRLALAFCFAFSTSPWAQSLPEAPAGLVPAERLAKKEAELKKAQADLQAAQAQLKQAAAKAAPDTEASGRLQQVQADLAEARKRIASLEAQLRDAERQRDEARTAAERAQAAARNKADPDPALRAERDRLKGELARAVDDKARLQGELRQAQAALQAKPAASSYGSGFTDTTSTQPTLTNAQELTIPNCGAACPSFIVLPQAGRVTMGTGSEAVTVDFKYRIAMGKTEVTVAQWKHFMADSGYKLTPNNTTYCDWQKEAVSDQHPVRCVSAEDADAYAAWFHKKYAGQLHARVQQVRLPNSDEWEYAARAGRWTQERQWDDGKENCALAGSANCTGNTPDPVAKKGRSPNLWGLYDTLGNVWEWTSTASGGSRVVRGGSFYGNDDNLRLPARNTLAPGGRLDNSGFRLLARIDL